MRPLTEDVVREMSPRTTLMLAADFIESPTLCRIWGRAVMQRLAALLRHYASVPIPPTIREGYCPTCRRAGYQRWGCAETRQYTWRCVRCQQEGTCNFIALQHTYEALRR